MTVFGVLRLCVVPFKSLPRTEDVVGWRARLTTNATVAAQESSLAMIPLYLVSGTQMATH